MLEFFVGSITSVDYANNSVLVSSGDTGGDLPIKLGNPLSLQEMPTIGSQVFGFKYIEDGQIKDIRIVRIWQNQPDLSRSGDGALLPGEVQYQGNGGSFMHLTNTGDVNIVDGSMRGIFQLLKKKLQAFLQSGEIVLKLFNGNSITLKKGGDISIKSVLNSAEITIANDGNIYLASKNIDMNKSTIDFKNVTSIKLGGGDLSVVLAPTGIPITSVAQLSTSNIIKGK